MLNYILTNYPINKDADNPIHRMRKIIDELFIKQNGKDRGLLYKDFLFLINIYLDQDSVINYR